MHLVGIFDTVAKRLGFTRLVSEQAQLGVASPWRSDDILHQVTLAELYELSDNVPVTRLNALTVGTVAAGRQIIAGTVGRIPLFTEQRGLRMPNQPQLMQQPERGLARSTSITWLVDDLIFYPCAWWHVTDRDAYGWPTWVERVKQSDARLDADGRLIGIGNRPVKDENVIRFDSPTGEGLLAHAKKTIRRALAIEIAAAFAEENPVPSIDLHDEGDTQLTREQVNDLVEQWREARRKGGVAYTPKSVRATAMGAHSSQLLIDGRRALSLDLVRHMGLPAWAASTAVEGATMTYDNRAMRNWELIDLTLGPYLAAIADRLSLPDVTPRGWATRFDLDTLTRPDAKTRFETYAIGLDKGFIDQAYIDAQEGAPMKGSA